MILNRALKVYLYTYLNYRVAQCSLGGSKRAETVGLSECDLLPVCLHLRTLFISGRATAPPHTHPVVLSHSPAVPPFSKPGEVKILKTNLHLQTASGTPHWFARGAQVDPCYIDRHTQTHAHYLI